MKQIHISQNQKISILFKENDFGGGKRSEGGEMTRAIFPASDINSSNLNRGSFNFRSPSGRALSSRPRLTARSNPLPRCNPPPLYSFLLLLILPHPPTIASCLQVLLFQDSLVA